MLPSSDRRRRADGPSFPLLVKASAGGGGRGHADRARRRRAWPRRSTSARREAAVGVRRRRRSSSSRYVERARHVEVQVLGRHARHACGRWASGSARSSAATRRSSRSRRRRRSTPELRAALCEAAVGGRAGDRLRRRRHRRVPASSRTARFVFLEMNTRLQVEHPVTECVSGVDLVALQLRGRRGRARCRGAAARRRGHAIEVRLYAEDPARDWRPQTGTLHRFEVPGVDAAFAPGPRAPAGLRGRRPARVGVHYDPMLAKVIAHGPPGTRPPGSWRRRCARRIHGSHQPGPAGEGPDKAGFLGG